MHLTPCSSACGHMLTCRHAHKTHTLTYAHMPQTCSQICSHKCTHARVAYTLMLLMPLLPRLPTPGADWVPRSW